MKPAPPIAAALALAALGAAALVEMPPVLVYNGSASAPIGFYRIDSQPLQHGDYVLAEVPEEARALATDRGYLPSDMPLIKRVAGLEGDRICRIAAFVLVNGTLAAIARRNDSQARPLPAWESCETLGPNRVFLLQDDPRSFDGRYFGPIDRALVLGRATPLAPPKRNLRPTPSTTIGRRHRNRAKTTEGKIKGHGAIAAYPIVCTSFCWRHPALRWRHGSTQSLEWMGYYVMLPACGASRCLRP